LPKTDPLKKSSQELILFADGVLKNVPNLAGNQAEVGRADWNVDRGKPVLDPIEEPRGPLFGGMDL
jgi:hypothetical protein